MRRGRDRGRADRVTGVFLAALVGLAACGARESLGSNLVTLPFEPANIGSAGQVGVVTRGWADPQNYKALKGAADFTSKKPGEPLQPGKFVTVTFPLQPDDQIIKPGQQLGLMIFSSDLGFTIHPAPGTELTIDLDANKGGDGESYLSFVIDFCRGLQVDG